MMGAILKSGPVTTFVAAAVALLMITIPVSAQDAKPSEPAPVLSVPASPSPVAETIAPPTDPIARAAFDTLDRHCARCHQVGKLIGRERPAKGFGNVLKLDEIAANPHLIRPGNALDSYLLRQVLDKQMPLDVYQEYSTKFPEPTASDVKALEVWINGLNANSVAACEAHKPISPDDMVRAMVTDLDKQLRQRQPTTRYLTLTHLANICVGPTAMKVYRQAAIKFLNSLGRSSNPIKLETIDPEATILRFDLLDLGWTAADWDGLLSVYPYNVQPDSEFSRTLANASATTLPYIRADWFAFTASQPPLYDELLKLPLTFQALAKEQGVDVEANIRNFVAQRAAFQKSGVSQNNRLIERHPSRNGYFWTSYDFGGNRDHQSLFDFPTGPSVEGFHHDGGETIISLPNGFQAYYLNTAAGQRLDKGPTSIVRDDTRKDFTVTNGISCMGCHDQGMRKARDQIRDFVLPGKKFPTKIKDEVEGLYPPHDKMDALIADDTKRFTEAMIRAGLDPALKLNGIEMINALAKRYEDDVDLALVTAELGLTKDQFAQASGDVNPKFRPLVRRLGQSSVPRDQFEVAFREFALDMTELKLVKLPKAQAQAQPVKPVSRPDDLALTSDANTYRVGDSPVFTVTASRDCFLTLSDIDDKGVGTVLLPNAYQQDNKIKAGVPVQFPGTNAPFKFRMKDPGAETIVAVCAIDANGGDRILHDFKTSPFTSIPNYDAVLAKSIAIDPVASGSRPSPASPNAALATASRPSLRAAIRVGVR